MKCEIIIDPDMYPVGKRILEAMVKARPIDIAVRPAYVGDCDLLMTYGLGHLGRRPAWEAHIASGRHAVGFDLGYWRAPLAMHGQENRLMRVTIDADHPQKWITEGSAERFDSCQIKLREDYSAKGPIVIIGLGPKTNVFLGQQATTWEKAAFARIRRVYPVTSILYRPKREDGTSLPGTKKVVGMPIEDVLRGASLVVCRHSNVAIDACIAGIPVACEDGAASVLYGSDFANPFRPTYEQRLRFLRNLAWWQWRPSEAAQCWQFLLTKIEEHDRVRIAA